MNMTKDNQDALRCADVAFLAGMNATSNHLRRLVRENEELRSELMEQCHINGMGGEREARLMAENEAKDALLRQVAEAFESITPYFPGDDKTRDSALAIIYKHIDQKTT